MEHLIHPSLLTTRVAIHLVGVGGNGAQMAACLARLDIAMKALGHPYGLHVTAFDADRVSEANVGRQLYSPADIGLNKAVLTVHRLNQFYGLDWQAEPYRYERHGEQGFLNTQPHIVISCVDSAAARASLHQRFFGDHAAPAYWLDLGNTEHSAQVVLGEPAGWTQRQALKAPSNGTAGSRPAGRAARLPCVTELFPALLSSAPDEDDTPSCSVRVSLASQGLFVNDVAVRFAAQLLYELFSQGRLHQHGVVINLEAKRSGPIDVDPSAWARFGHVPVFEAPLDGTADIA